MAHRSAPSVVILFLLWQSSVWTAVQDAGGGSANITEFLLHRQKRFLTFANGGNIKVVMGPILPINLGDPIAWRSILILYNLQGLQYDIPTTPLYPWDKWESIFTRSMQTGVSVREFDTQALNKLEDDARTFLYTALEGFMDRRSDGRGRECLLRSICENAQVHQHVGLLAEALDIVLTPGKSKIDRVYRQARSAGLGGADCFHQYRYCPPGANFLDGYFGEL